ncbi:MAG: fumarylacetoacetate hydrolase family protein [Burkholderiaceae bacterium]
MNKRVDTAADWLIERQRKKGPFSPFPEALAPASLADAYAVQRRFVQLKSRACGAPVGWKIALSNPAMQAMCGLDAPIAGRLSRRQVVGGPARVRAADYGRLLLEFEIAVELGATLDAAADHRFTADEAAAAVVAVRPAFELVDDHAADYAVLGQHALQLVADNAWNQGAVLGESRGDWRDLDLAAIRGEVWIDGELSGTGHGRDLMGHPLQALAWLASHANEQGSPMRAGEWAILGTLVTSRFPHAGQCLEFRLEGFAPLLLTVD